MPRMSQTKKKLTDKELEAAIVLAYNNAKELEEKQLKDFAQGKPLNVDRRKKIKQAKEQLTRLRNLRARRLEETQGKLV